MNRSTRDARRLCGAILSLAVLLSGLALPGYSSSRAARPDGASTRLKDAPGRQDGGPQDNKSIDFTAPAAKTDKGVDENHEEAPRGRIAFASDRDDNFEIYVVDPDGGGLTRLTNNPAEDLGPAWSPDGTRIAFVSNRDGNQEIYTMNADGSNQTRLTNNAAADLEPAWSPDGTRIAFVSNRAGNDEVFVMNAADGTGLVNLTNNGADDNNPAWAPSGTLLAFSSNRDGDKTEIYRMNADGTNVVRLTNNTFNDLAPTWPMGRITFQSDRDGNDEIYTMNALDGTNVIRLTNNTAFDLDPSRAPDGARIAFVSNRDEAANLDIYVMNPEGVGVVRLTNHPNADMDPAVQPLAAASGTVQFSASAYTVSEGAGSVAVTVTRTGTTTGGLIVDLFTNSGTASERSDFTAIFRTLEFAPNETSRTVNIPVIDDVFVEFAETFSVTLARPTGGGLGSPSTAVVTITDNDNPPSPTSPVTVFAVTTTNNLLTFSSATPGTLSATAAITGLQTGETVVGIDVRPATRQLYALGSTGRLYIVNPVTGAATLASTVSTALSGTAFGVDFNPVPDRLRVTSDADQNLRINVDTGAATVDTPLAYAAGDANAGQNPNVVGSAYTNNVAGATTTTLYGIDSNRDVLVTQNPPNDGTLNTVGALGVNTSDVAGFDIATGSGTAFAALNTGGGETGLYTINLTTGAATLVGQIGPAGTGMVRGLTVVNPFPNPIDETAFFVRQQYLDFLNREPDAAGLAFWTNNLTGLIAGCNSITDAVVRSQCVRGARAQVSTAFFLSIEFQETGLFVIQVYQEAFGRLPTFREFLEDVGAIREGVIIGQPGAFELLAANRREFLDRFVARGEFRARYDGVSNAAYVNALFTNAGVDPATEAATRDALVAGLNDGTETRATVLPKVGATRSVFNAIFNRAFVLMEYFGYLRRDPDTAGFNFWVNQLNSFSVAGEDVRIPSVALARIRRAQMVEAFIASIEYRGRFGPS
jgi:dipeptidyl aminopeptidase/acylaminoacyl peptidase